MYLEHSTTLHLRIERNLFEVIGSPALVHVSSHYYRKEHSTHGIHTLLTLPTAVVVLNLCNVTYGWQGLAFDALPAVDIFSGLQVAGDARLPAEAAQHPCISGAG